MIREVLVFCRRPEDVGLVRNEGVTPGERNGLLRLMHSINLDLAEQLALELSFRVTLCEIRSCLQEDWAPNALIRRVVRTEERLDIRIQNCLRDMFAVDEGSHVAAFLGHNPLYPLELVKSGLDLLDQNDDVVVVGQGFSGMSSTDCYPPMWIAMKRFHPQFVADVGTSIQGSPVEYLRSIDESIIVPITQGEDMRSSQDLPGLKHSIERELLLNRWYPKRTLEALRHMEQSRWLTEVTL